MNKSFSESGLTLFSLVAVSLYLPSRNSFWNVSKSVTIKSVIPSFSTTVNVSAVNSPMFTSPNIGIESENVVFPTKETALCLSFA